jgi:hypothetical protein
MITKRGNVGESRKRQNARGVCVCAALDSTTTYAVLELVHLGLIDSRRQLHDAFEPISRHDRTERLVQVKVLQYASAADPTIQR